MTIHVFEHQEIHPDGLSLLRAHGWTISTELEPQDPAVVKAILVRSYTQVDAAVLDRFPQLMFVIRVGVGLETIDLAACRARNIQVLHSPGSNCTAVAEHAIWLMVTLLRQVDHQRRQLARGAWRDVSKPGQQLSSQTIGLVGFGAVGQAIARIVTAYGATCQAFDPYVPTSIFDRCGVKSVDWATLWSSSTLVCVQLPATPETINSIGAAELAALPKGSWLVNVGRGEVLNETAVMAALTEGQLAGVGLDVFTGEPSINPAWSKFENVVMTPHMAALTEEAQRAMTLMPIEQLVQVWA